MVDEGKIGVRDELPTAINSTLTPITRKSAAVALVFSAHARPLDSPEELRHMPMAQAKDARRAA